MDAMVNIIKNHLGKDGARPLIATKTSPVVDSSEDIDMKFEEDMSCLETPVEGQPPDKIIVYSYFIENFPLVEKVSVLCAYYYSFIYISNIFC